ncbi:MAG: MATE family efflux transporter [Victivallales bacterium]|nr:MATE family efflux transporter [Victivallales bacterium]
MLKELFEDKPFYRKLTSLTVPIALQSLMLAMVAAADAVMLGRVDQNAMAAVSLATQIQFVQNMILGTVVSVVGILGAQYWGKNDKAVLGKIFGMAIRHSVVISVAFFIGCVYYPRYLMRCFANDETLLDIGSKYLRIAGWSYLLTGISQCYLAIMKVSDHVPRTAWISSVTVVINIILNSVFIFGLFGVPAYGAEGAAIATLIARIIELLWCIASSYQKNFIRLELRDLFSFDRLLAKDYWQCILPLIGAYLFWGVGFTSYTAIIGQLGPDAASANAIASGVRDLMCCLCNGLCTAGGILIGNELGAGRLEQGRKYGDRLAILSFIIGFFSTFVILATIPPVLHYMKLSDKAQSYLVGMFIILSIYMIGRCVNTIIINGIFSAGGDTMFDFYSLAVCMWGIAVPCALIGAFWLHWHVLIVYSCTCLDEVGKIPWVMHHYRKYKWVKNLTR